MPSTARGHVLVVDDDEAVRHLFVEVLHHAGYATVEAATLTTASAVLDRGEPEVICIVLDGRLPDGHGYDLLRRVRDDRRLETLPVIVITGDDDPSREIEGLDAGATDFLVKPVTPEALVARVGAHLRDRAAWLTMLDVAVTTARRGAGDDDHTDLDAIIETGAFQAVFQPIVDLQDGRNAGYEALTRFDDGSSPELRFAEASAVGRGFDLELATLACALDSASHLPDDVYVSLNVTPGLLSPGTGGLQSLLESAPCQVVLEITEREAIDDYDVVRSALSGFVPTVRLSIDDAGAGFASLRHVVMLQPDFVKLDRTWVSGIHVEPTKQAMVAGLVHFANATGCILVAEGIEADDERSMLVELGVHYGQGYLLGRPEVVR